MQTEIIEVKSDCCSCHAVEESKVCCQQGRCPHCFCNSFHNNGNCRWSSKCKVNQGTLHDREANSSGLHGVEQNEFSAAGISYKMTIVGFCFGGGHLVETLARDI